MTHFNPQVGFWEIAWPGFFRGVGSGFIFVPLTTLSLGAVSKEQMANASGLFNMVRTIGGSIGIALLITFLSRGAQVHQNYLTAHIHPYNPELWQRFALAHSGALPETVGGGMLDGSFLALIYREVQQQALLMSFVDDFRLLAYIFLALSPIVFLMRRPQSGGSISAH
jgi:DHA2 family multidrug resistance protein